MHACRACGASLNLVGGAEQKMPKIIITTDDGEIIEEIEVDSGDFLFRKRGLLIEVFEAILRAEDA